MFLLAKSMTGAFLARYTVGAAAALCALAIVLLSSVPLDRSVRRRCLILVSLLALLIPVGRQIAGLRTTRFRADFVDHLVQVQEKQPAPIVLSDDGLFVEITAGPDTRPVPNCYFVYDALPETRTNVDLAVAGLLKVLPLQAQTFDDFWAVHREFNVIGDSSSPVIQRSVREGATVTYRHDVAANIDYWHVMLPAFGPSHL
jgi:hypothetical protein